MRGSKTNTSVNNGIEVPRIEPGEGQTTSQVERLLKWASEELAQGNSCTIILPDAGPASFLVVHGHSVTEIDYREEIIRVRTED